LPASKIGRLSAGVNDHKRLGPENSPESCGLAPPKLPVSEMLGNRAARAAPTRALRRRGFLRLQESGAAPAFPKASRRMASAASYFAPALDCAGLRQQQASRFPSAHRQFQLLHAAGFRIRRSPASIPVPDEPTATQVASAAFAGARGAQPPAAGSSRN
jgi:hypothetical protein